MSPTPRPIRFVFRGRVVEVAQAPVTRTVLQWLREDARACGTKEGCAEGDCGACTVLVGGMPHASSVNVVGPAGRALELKSVNACIQLLPTLDGKALFTVEDLKAAAGGGLHPVQSAMVATHGSQCGFCTPGFVMSLTQVYELHQQEGSRPSRQAVADALSGNLCRCTGYRPILDAGLAMFEAPAVRLDVASARGLLDGERSEQTFEYQAPAWRPGRVDRFWAPRTVEALAELRVANPKATLLAGSTDVGLWVTKQFRDVGDLLFIGEVDALKAIEETATHVVVGAAVSLEAGYRALVRRWPTLEELWLRFASPPIRNAGTLCGNLANGSPIGDTAPALMALGAELVLRKGAAVRVVPLEQFSTGYMTNVLEAGELVEAVRVPLPVKGQALRVYKLSKRFDCDISAVCGAFGLRLNGEGVLEDVRIAFGGMAAMAKRASRVEAAMIGRPWTKETLDAARLAMKDDFAPLSDLRASSEYRRTAASNLLTRVWLETRVHAPLAPEQVSVFARRA